MRAPLTTLRRLPFVSGHGARCRAATLRASRCERDRIAAPRYPDVNGIVRIAAATDVRSIEDIVERAYARYVRDFGIAPVPLDDDYAGRVTSGEAYVIERDEGVVGLVVVERAIDHVRLENVAVDPNFQRQGYGSALLAFVESLAASWHVCEVRLYTNVVMVENIARYRRLGYRETHRARIDRREAVFMRKFIGT